MLNTGRFKEWNTIIAKASLKIRDVLEQLNLNIVEEFLRMRDAGLVARIRILNVCGLFRQGWRGNSSLMIALIFKKI